MDREGFLGNRCRRVQLGSEGQRRVRVEHRHFRRLRVPGSGVPNCWGTAEVGTETAPPPSPRDPPPEAPGAPGDLLGPPGIPEFEPLEPQDSNAPGFEFWGAGTPGGPRGLPGPPDGSGSAGRPPSASCPHYGRTPSLRNLRQAWYPKELSMIEAFGVEAAVILRGLTAVEVGMVLAPALLGTRVYPGGDFAPPRSPTQTPGLRGLRQAPWRASDRGKPRIQGRGYPVRELIRGPLGPC